MVGTSQSWGVGRRSVLRPSPRTPLRGVPACLSRPEDDPGPSALHRVYTAVDVAAALTDLAARKVVARELPRPAWETALRRGGLGASYARLIGELFDAHNAGRIEVATGGEVRRGTTELNDVIASLLRG